MTVALTAPASLPTQKPTPAPPGARRSAGPDRRGSVHLVGAGPGDPDLLTLRAARLLARCDVVAHDRLVAAAVLDLVRPDAERICVGKTAGRPGWRQEDINALLVTEAAAGRMVVRLKGGDPFVFGRGSEEALACRAADVDVEIVPGITAAVAAPAAAGIPVTHRGVASGVAFVTGHEDPDKPDSQLDWNALARFPGTLVFLMGVRTAATIAGRLVANGRDPATPAAAVQWATTPQQRVVRSDLASLAGDLAHHGIGAPATLVVGDVVDIGALITSGSLAPAPGFAPRTVFASETDPTAAARPVAVATP